MSQLINEDLYTFYFNDIMSLRLRTRSAHFCARRNILIDIQKIILKKFFK